MTTARPSVYADLHLHSTASDGLVSPTDLPRLARSHGLSAIALTDHDTLAGIPAALDAAREIGLELIPGIEISCNEEEGDESMHVLGLFLDPHATCIEGFLTAQQRARFTRAFQMLDLLEREGIPVEPLRRTFERDPGKVLGRPHVARYLLEIGVVMSFQDAFELYLKRGRPAYVPKLPVSPAEAIDAIHQAGGLAFMAHPGLKTDFNTLWNWAGHLPWDGMEVHYAEHSPEQIVKFSKIVRERGWLASGGSDYHGEHSKEANRIGGAGIDEMAFRHLAQAAAERRAARSRNRTVLAGRDAVQRNDKRASITPEVAMTAGVSGL